MTFDQKALRLDVHVNSFVFQNSGHRFRDIRVFAQPGSQLNDRHPAAEPVEIHSGDAGRRWHESAGGDLQRSSNMSSSAEYGGQIVAVVTKLVGGDLQVEFLAPNQNPSFIHTVEARSESVGPRATARHRKNAPTKAEKDFEMTKHAKLLLKHDESSIVRYARKQIEGKMTGLETRDFYDAIVKCADARRAPGESDAQAFTKTIIEDATGRLLFKALQLAPSSTTKAQPAKAPSGPHRGSRSGLPTAGTPTATATT